MKKIFAFALLLLIAKVLPAQSYWGVNFDDAVNVKRVHIDLTSHHHNSWKIGSAAKTVFDSGYYTKQSIVTDLTHPVAAADTSVFTIYHLRDSAQLDHNFYLEFWYRLDGLSHDSATVEVSPDNGISWINVVKEAAAYHFTIYPTYPPTPVLGAGSTSGWTFFYAGMHEWAKAHSGDGSNFPRYLTTDSVLFRFTYKTDTLLHGLSNADSIKQVKRNGWQIDDMYVIDQVVSSAGINNLGDDNLIKIYPNPATDEIFISSLSNATHSQVQLFNLLGEVVYQDLNFVNQPIDTRALPNGTYILKYANADNYSLKKLVIKR